jgi:superfamily II DNA or RNA helicase
MMDQLRQAQATQVRLRVPVGFEPRTWAKQAYAAYCRHPFKDFSVNACPGAGKTKFAVMLAYNELRRGAVDRVDIIGPSVHICEQWMREFASWGLALDPENAQESRDCVGRVCTYQRLGMDPNAFLARDKRKTLVVLDEIHHAGDSKTWGDALRMVFGAATRRLLLSGTPFRSDNNPIPFVRYMEGDKGQSISDYSYGYGEALRDGYCAPLYFPHHDGEFEWERDGKTFAASFSTYLDRNVRADRLRTALEPTGAYVQGLLQEAHQQLLEIRQTHPRAAGIVFGRDVENVQQLAEVLHTLTGTRPVIVTNDLVEAGERIRRFRDSSMPWIVSVKMISEGVDIPRLRVGVYLSNVRTELFFRQAAGRLVRLVSGVEDQSGYLYIPSDLQLVRFAVEMQSERKHFLEAKQKAEEEPELLAAQREERTLDEEPDYRFLRSEGNRVGVIDTGPPATESGQGLFDFTVEMMPELLEPLSETPPVAKPEPGPTELLHEQKDNIRRRGGRISSLVNDVSSRYNLSFRQVHAKLNRRQGIKAQSMCTLEQLHERERLLEEWLRKGSL